MSHKNQGISGNRKKEKVRVREPEKLEEVGDNSELHPTEPPLIDVNFIRLNNTVTIAALWSSTGVMVMEIPKRWGSNSCFRGGKPVILTR
ncbi:hypothetical protein RUM43_010056 [Polyplax serrata]|uniref:Uncharacterized protein n=1 Tax=Polyplax serrata TaxID=468196 RepID=A0AAN8PK26_POLSC